MRTVRLQPAVVLFVLASLSVALALPLIRPVNLSISLPAVLDRSPALAGSFTLDARTAHRWAVEDVYWRYRVWPAENPGPKPALAAVLTSGQVRATVEEGLRLSDAVDRFWGRSITGAQLQAEMDRMARDTRQPEVLRELFSALGNDPAIIAETLARPVLADRLARSLYAGDTRFDAHSVPFEQWWSGVRGDLSAQVRPARHAYALPAITAAPAVESWTPTHALPEANEQISGVWTGSEMIVWGGTEVGQSTFNSGSRYDPATDTWRTTSGVNAPFPRKQHTAVWSGTEMIVWGGCGLLDEHSCQIASGGRYNPVTDTWQATTMVNAPEARLNHTAVWTGSAMIVWGGCRFSNNLCQVEFNTGGRYDPMSDTWHATSTAGAPEPRQDHTAVWTGTEMIVWGGRDVSAVAAFSTGGRYDPDTDTWQATAPVPAGQARYDHSAVWTGSQMIVWGGTNGTAYLNSGLRYFPSRNRWRVTSRTGAPSPRADHTAVWSGTEMIVFGGCSGNFCNTKHQTGGRYDPASNTWAATSTAGAPAARSGHVAVWTGSLMVVWGGVGGDPREGGRYDPASDTWTPTNSNEATSARSGHTAVWTGVEMIVWGGDDRFFGTVNTGGRYFPATDSWQATPTGGAPSGRHQHTAIWTGSEMIVWAGSNGSFIDNRGGRYNPSSNSWTSTSTAGAPEARASHTAVWTGGEMIVWGGAGFNSPWIRTGGRYNPSTNSWTRVTTAGAPVARAHHAAVWTGSQMIVWGGATATFDTNTGGRYDPDTDSWTPTSLAGAPSKRNQPAAVWTGSRMVIWGGQTYDGTYHYHDTGARYDPVTDTWTPTTTVGAPSPRAFMAYVWTGSELIVWAGCGESPACVEAFFTGGRYDPAVDSWTATTVVGGPSARGGATGVWTGSQMIVWGGATDDSATYTNTGGRYTPGPEAGS
jgi:N-acetylneuraminic acid mutarotase